MRTQQNITVDLFRSALPTTAHMRLLFQIISALLLLNYVRNACQRLGSSGGTDFVLPFQFNETLIHCRKVIALPYDLFDKSTNQQKRGCLLVSTEEEK